eukprot:TRINITY_DN96817_c0_g1_i1.p1 TRINITY_DN96817_c0_g1~~TRINITY_DN96817_c0_g1_i1.p1  ORF type:complete len:161 (+),score=24.82 TRINITY_DN96817_c0_g1_i1:43-483(+)
MALVKAGSSDENRSRSLSPTTALWEGRREVREKMATMAHMGLHVFHPEWQSVPQGLMPRGRQYSTSFKTAHLRILGTDESISFPVQTCTKVADVKEALARSLMVDPEGIAFLQKRGCTTRRQLDSEEIGANVTVKGIASFRLMIAF